MRKLIMWNIITLDGYFEGDKNWDLQFHELVWGPELEKISIEQLKAADCLVFGRVTYEGMAAYWKTEKGEIADIGCGTGGQTMVLAQNTAGEIIGVELWSDFIKQFNQNAQNQNLQDRVKGVVGNMENLPFQEEELDLIW